MTAILIIAALFLVGAVVLGAMSSWSNGTGILGDVKREMVYQRANERADDIANDAKRQIDNLP